MRRLGLIATFVLSPLVTSLGFAGSQNYNVTINGMTCDGCVKSVTSALSKLPNVTPGSVKVVLKENKATLAVAEDQKDMSDQIKKAVEKAGYKVTSVTTMPSAKPVKN